MPLRVSQDPIPAVKWAVLRSIGGGVFFTATSFQASYLADDVAECLVRGTDHEAPDPSCTCGFYGLKTGAFPRSIFPVVKLDVEFLGRVLVMERGYRAQRQRVLSVTIPRRCNYPGCRGAVESVLLAPFAPWGSIVRGVPQERGGDPLRPVSLCSLHRPSHIQAMRSPLPLLTPSALGGMLGTEVRWG